MPASTDYTIYILAQGKSSRMGNDKGLEKLNGKELVQHCIDNLKPLQKEIVLITGNSMYKKFGCRIISDKVKGLGPAQGILTALEDTRTKYSLIVSCDMPFVNQMVVQELDQEVQAEIICYAQEMLYPFPGFYSRQVFKSWKEKVAAGEQKLQKLIKLFNYKSLPIEHHDLFLNVNTPQDIKQIEERLK